MTFVMFGILGFITIPAALHDLWTTESADAGCKSAYGQDWRAFSKFASTGRNDFLLFFNGEERPCFNPT
jgi:hypothetical protein